MLDDAQYQANLKDLFLGPFHFVLTEYSDPSFETYRGKFLEYLGRSTELYIRKLTEWHFPGQFEELSAGRSPLNDGTLQVNDLEIRELKKK